MKIIGVIGFIGSGKNEFSDYIISKYRYMTIDYGDIIRDLATQIGKTHNRYDLQDTQREFAEKRGLEFFGSEVVRKIKENKWEKIVLTGIRRPEDFDVPKKIYEDDMIVVFVDADEKTRFNRLKARNSPRDPQTFDEFCVHEDREFEMFPYLRELSEKADYHIDNNGTIEELREHINQFMKAHGLT